LQAAHIAMAHVGGKMVVCTTTLPNVGSSAARLKNRDNAATYGTDREHSLRNPEEPFWKKLAAECSRVQIGVDLFSFAPAYTDLASLSTLAKYTGGQVMPRCVPACVCMWAPPHSRHGYTAPRACAHQPPFSLLWDVYSLPGCRLQSLLCGFSPV
jgi:hypothetical protein